MVSESTPPLLITGNKGKEKETKKRRKEKKNPPVTHYNTGLPATILSRTSICGLSRLVSTSSLFFSFDHTRLEREKLLLTYLSSPSSLFHLPHPPPFPPFPPSPFSYLSSPSPPILLESSETGPQVESATVDDIIPIARRRLSPPLY